METASDYSDEEVGVESKSQLKVHGICAHNICADFVSTQHTSAAVGVNGHEKGLPIQPWRDVTRLLQPNISVLHVLAVFGGSRDNKILLRDEKHDTDADSERNDQSEGRKTKVRALLLNAKVVEPAQDSNQSQTEQNYSQQNLGERDKVIDQLEEQIYKSRMQQHDANYLLDSYLQDQNKCSEVNDRQTSNLQSHINHKYHILEHYTIEEYSNDKLTQHGAFGDLDDLTKIRNEIELLEKLAVVNKNLHREEELEVRLIAELKKYMEEKEAHRCVNSSQMSMLLDKIEQELEKIDDMQPTAMKQETDMKIFRKRLLDELTLELEEEELHKFVLERQLTKAMGIQSILYKDIYLPIQEVNATTNG